MMRLIKPREAKTCSIICAVLFLTVFCIPVAQAQFGQATKTHDLGDFRLLHFSEEDMSTNTDDATDGTGQWPQDVSWSGNVTFQDRIRYVGTWVDQTGATQSKTSHTGASFIGQEPFVMREVRRAEPPEVLPDLMPKPLASVDECHSRPSFPKHDMVDFALAMINSPVLTLTPVAPITLAPCLPSSVSRLVAITLSCT